jgi:hypothetical protein
MIATSGPILPCPASSGELIRTKISCLNTRSSADKTTLTLRDSDADGSAFPLQQVWVDSTLAFLDFAKQFFRHFCHTLWLEAEFPLEFLERG